jgi:hypothetical protein
MAFNRKWTQAEDAYLSRHYGTSPPEDIAKDLGRTKKAIWSRAEALKLTSVTQNKIRFCKSREKREKEVLNRARYHDPFGRPLAIFCIKNITVHRVPID